jgi:hypothetical protein
VSILSSSSFSIAPSSASLPGALRRGGASRASALGLALASISWLSACGDDQTRASASPNGDATGFAVPEGPVYSTVAQLDTPNGSTTLVSFTGQVPSGELDTGRALEVAGFAEVASHDNSLYVANGEAFTITRYDIEDNQLVERGVLGLGNQGITFIGKLYIVDSQRAFLVNGEQFEILEWNPTTMQVTNTYDISALSREGWGNELRNGYLREADGTLFIVWAYTNDRVEFVNDFVVGVFDTASGAFDVIVDEACPASAAFGGFFDEVGDLYLPADSFGGFTFFDGADPKEPCIRRFRAGEKTIDASYTMRPMQALGGLAPWGLYYAGSGVAYTTAVDPNRLPEYSSVFEFIFATIHEGYALDLVAGTSQKIEGMPPDAVGFESATIEGQVLIPRSAGAVQIYEVDNVQTRVYTLDPQTKQATPRFTMPGYFGGVRRLR